MVVAHGLQPFIVQILFHIRIFRIILRPEHITGRIPDNIVILLQPVDLRWIFFPAQISSRRFWLLPFLFRLSLFYRFFPKHTSIFLYFLDQQTASFRFRPVLSANSLRIWRPSQNPRPDFPVSRIFFQSKAPLCVSAERGLMFLMKL